MITKDRIKIEKWSAKEEAERARLGDGAIGAPPFCTVVKARIPMVHATMFVDEGLSPTSFVQALTITEEQLKRKLVHILYGDFQKKLLELGLVMSGLAPHGEHALFVKEAQAICDELLSMLRGAGVPEERLRTTVADIVRDL